MAFLLEGATCAASTAASFALYSLAWATVVQGFAGVGAGVGAGWQHCFCPHLRLKHTAPAFWGMVPAAHVKLAQVGGGGVVVAVVAGVVVTVVAGVVVTVLCGPAVVQGSSWQQRALLQLPPGHTVV